MEGERARESWTGLSENLGPTDFADLIHERPSLLVPRPSVRKTFKFNHSIAYGVSTVSRVSVRSEA